MIAGHAAVALAAKTRAPTASLGWFVAAAYGLDLLWPVFLLVGAERVVIAPGVTAFTPLQFEHYPWSHSLLMSVVWGGLFSGVALAAGLTGGAAILLGAVVVSHWFLDLPMHVRDLPLWPGTSPEVGLGLWRSIVGTLLVEGAVFAVGTAVYLRASRPSDRIGREGLVAFLVFVVAVWASGPFAPPPPNERALAFSALSLWIFVFWAAWVDRHRVTYGGG